MRRIKRGALFAAVLILCLTGLGARLGARRVPVQSVEAMLRAQALMEDCMAQIRGYKAALGIALSPEDWFETGLIGDAYSPITTTLGPIEAKRTSADSTMAALLVRMLTQAGVAAGDRVGAGFSGSFPGLNLAVMCACAAMDVELVYICSAGASTYGANQPELTFADMAYQLAADGLLPAQAAAVSLGGDGDCGLDMDAALCARLRARTRARGLCFLYEADYAENLARRRALYEAAGPLDCFVGVGGGLTTQGRGEAQVSWGLTRPGSVRNTDDRSGLLDIYNAEGLPVINLLNIRRVVAEYGLPYDPQQPTAAGESAVYSQTRYPPAVLAAGIAAAALVLLAGAARFKKDARGRKDS